jgi:Rrf2 family transcriptional regulator, iron-sulfur cluster assembly transcription factor
MQLVLQGRTNLALEALLQLHEAGERVSGRSLAGAIGTSTSYLPQILAPMLRSGWISSERGPSGGYQLVTPLEDLSLLDLIEAYEGSLTGTTCLLRGGPCPADDRCPFHAAWNNVARAMTSEMSARTVLDAVGSKEGS